MKTVEWPAGPCRRLSPERGRGRGRGLIVPVQENKPILDAKLANKGMGGGLPVIIDQGMRAVSVGVDQVVGVVGCVTPSTRVDVL